MHICILTFDGFNELDSLIALGILNRIKKAHWRVSIAAPTERVCSMNGVSLARHAPLSEANAAEVVLIGSGMKTREVIADDTLMAQLTLDPERQLIGAQCSGTLLLAKLGLLNHAACTDLTTKPWLEEMGINALSQAFSADGNVASAGGCLASQYLAFWVIARLEGLTAAQEALYYVAPVGEKEAYVSRALANVQPFLSQAQV